MQKQNNKQNKLNKKNGIQMEFYESGEVKRDYYLVNNKMHGNDTWRYENGQIDILCPYVNGEKLGESFGYYENGNIHSIINYVNDAWHGKCINYYENGNIECDGNYVNDKKHGIQKWFYENGQLERFMNYVHGVRHGQQIEYQLEKTGEYFLLSKSIVLNGISSVYAELKKDDMFMCEDKYYKVTRGTITRSSWGSVKKSNNLKVVLMKWKLQHSVIVPSDGHSKKVHHINRYELVEDGASMKLMTFNRNISLTPYLEASLAIEWKTETERAEKLSKIKNLL